MKRILVFGERSSSLQRLIDLRAMRPSWDGAAVSDPQDAERALNNERFDAVIAEVGSPMDERLRFLNLLQTDYPAPARVVVAYDPRSHAQLQAACQPAGFVGSESPVEDVANVVERSLDISELIQDHALKVLIDQIDTLPPAPTVYLELNQALANDNASAATVAAIIGQDPSLASEILKVVNSALFGLRREITSIAEAVALLGFAMVRNLALSVAVYRSVSGTHRRRALQIEKLQQHALNTARLASGMAPNRVLADEFYLAGLLHDVGKLVFTTLRPEFLEQVDAEAQSSNRPRHEVERDLGGGVTHTEAGAYLLHAWGLPYAIIEAAAFHHQPERVPQTAFDALAAVHIANRLAHDPQDTCEDYLARLEAGCVAGSEHVFA